MSKIALYNALTKLGLEPDEVQEAVAGVANSKGIATKADIKDMATKTDLAKLETRLTKLICAIATINTGVIITAVGLMIKFLN